MAVFAIAFGLKILDRDEAQRRGIDAISQAAAILRSVGKNVAEMAVTMFGPDLDSSHAVCVVFLGDYIVGFYRLYKAWPATAGIKLVVRCKKRLARNDIDIKPIFLVIPEIITKRWFGTAFLCHMILLGGQVTDGVRVFVIFAHISVISVRERLVGKLGGHASLLSIFEKLPYSPIRLLLQGVELRLKFAG